VAPLEASRDLKEPSVEIRIAVPRVPAGLIANLLGLLGLVAFALAVGGLTHQWWWSVLVGGVFAVGLSYVAQTQAASAEAVPAAPVLAVDATQPIDERAREAAYIRGLPTPASA
jgi:hypothetical protein